MKAFPFTGEERARAPADVSAEASPIPSFRAEAPSLLIVDVAWPPETFIRRKIEGLAARGFDVTVATTRRGRPSTVAGVHRVIRTYGPGMGLHAVALGLTRGAARLSLHRPSRWPSVFAGIAAGSPGTRERIARLRRYLPVAAESPDAVHFEWLSSAIAYLPMFDVWEAPVVVSCRGRQLNIDPHLPDGVGHRRGLGAVFDRAALIHCVSDAIAGEARGLGAPTEKIRVIRPAVDPAFFTPGIAGAHAGPLRISMVGSLIWRKGYEYALRAAALLRDAGVDFTLRIAGEGPDEQMIRFSADDLCLHDAVCLLGPLSPAEIRDELQRSDVLLHTSLSEGIANVVLEAMSCALPVVVSDCGGMREAVTDGVEGFVVPTRDPAAAAQRLLQLAQDPQLGRRMGAAARRRVQADFDLAEQAPAYARIYEEAIAEARR